MQSDRPIFILMTHRLNGKTSTLRSNCAFIKSMRVSCNRTLSSIINLLIDDGYSYSKKI